jgi:signal transduction histidine kinase
MAGERVLIVDDELDVLELCERILQVNGYEVRIAHSGYEAVELAKGEPVDLLLTDIKMPGMSGLEIARALRSSDPGVICIAMTGYGTIDMVLEALKLGIDEFILKPFTPDELSLTVSKAMEKERLRKENFRLNALIPLFELNKTLMRTVEEDLVLQRLLEIAQVETKASIAQLYTFEKNDTIQYGPGLGLVSNSQGNQLCDELAGRIKQAGQQLYFTADQAELAPLSLAEAGLRAVIATPIKTKETTLGALILARRVEDFAPSDLDFLSMLSSQAGVALENARLFTEIQEAYKELKQLDHMKREFINIAAHELRTPLTILMGYASVLEEETNGQPKDFVLSITRNAMRLRALIDDMLNLNYLESGVARLANDRLDLAEVMQEILKDMTLLAEQKDLTITLDIPDDFPQIIIDRQKFDLILINLFHNAIKFTRPGGKVGFKARATTDKMIISLSDTGIGIPKEHLGRIFDRFYQVEASLTREYGGIGLGLAIARGMVEVCGGEIKVESQPGEGTTFTFILPLENSNLKPSKLTL